MGFFNSLLIRIALALLGAVLYGLLIYSILGFTSFSDLALILSIPVSLLYFISRLILLLSGIPTPYYSRRKGSLFKSLPEHHPFRKRAGLIGYFYHIHDIALLIVLGVICIGFIISLFIDGSSGRSMGTTFQDLWRTLLPPPD